MQPLSGAIQQRPKNTNLISDWTGKLKISRNIQENITLDVDINFANDEIGYYVNTLIPLEYNAPHMRPRFYWTAYINNYLIMFMYRDCFLDDNTETNEYENVNKVKQVNKVRLIDDTNCSALAFVLSIIKF